MQKSFYYLALSNTRRVGRLASSPETLAVWALEILRDAAEAALKFVQVGVCVCVLAMSVCLVVGVV